MQSASVVSQHRPTVIFPVFGPLHSTDTISQVELGLLASLRDRLAKVQHDVDAAEADMRARLEAGATVQSGEFSASLRTSERRNVSWKSVAVRLAERLKLDGEAYCNRVLAATRPTTSVRLEIARAQAQ